MLDTLLFSGPGLATIIVTASVSLLIGHAAGWSRRRDLERRRRARQELAKLGAYLSSSRTEPRD